MDNVTTKILQESVPVHKADFLPNIFREHLPVFQSGRLPVVLFGAGSAGKELLPILKIHGVNPVGFCDHHLDGDKTMYCGLPVIPPESLEKEHQDSLLIITSGKFSFEIREQLIKKGFDPQKIITIKPAHLYYYTHIIQWYWTREYLRKNRNKLERAYQLFGDEKSKAHFVHRISLLTNGADFASYLRFLQTFSEIQWDEDSLTKIISNENYHYFTNDIFSLSDHESYLDVGSFTGDSVEEFVFACRNRGYTYDHIYCMEPETNNFSSLVDNTSIYPNIHYYNLGAWVEKTRLTFIRDGGSSQITEQAGDFHIDVVTIDELMNGRKITLLKMDIEGSEINALKGAQETIKKWKPKLAISIYHRRDDIMEIPLLLHRYNPDYRFHIRLYSNHFSETVLFAV